MPKWIHVELHTVPIRDRAEPRNLGGDNVYRGAGWELEVSEAVDHPAHYGGDTVYEAIKVIEAWGLGFCLGNTVKYISRAGKKGAAIEDLKKARWYLDREIQNRESK